MGELPKINENSKVRPDSIWNALGWSVNGYTIANRLLMKPYKIDLSQITAIEKNDQYFDIAFEENGHKSIIRLKSLPHFLRNFPCKTLSTKKKNVLSNLSYVFYSPCTSFIFFVLVLIFALYGFLESEPAPMMRVMSILSFFILSFVFSWIIPNIQINRGRRNKVPSNYLMTISIESFLLRGFSLAYLLFGICLVLIEVS